MVRSYHTYIPTHSWVPTQQPTYKILSLSLALVYKLSKNCGVLLWSVKAEVSDTPMFFGVFFLATMVQLFIKDKIYTEISSMSSITNRGPIEFFIPGDGENYLDLSDTFLHLHMKVTNGMDLANDAVVALISYILHTTFNQCNVIYWDTLISPLPSHDWDLTQLFREYTQDSIQHQSFL